MTTEQEYIDNIRSFYDRASDQDIIDGRTWYPSMARIMREHATISGLRVAQCAAVYAATSINMPWARNLALAAQAIHDYEAGYIALRNGGTLTMVVDKVRRIIASNDDADINIILTSDKNNRKIVSFARNLIDDDEEVTVDRWAYRIATNFEGCECTRSNTHGCGKVPTGAEYINIANAYRAVAKLVNERALDLQAITWCVVRGTGE